MINISWLSTDHNYTTLLWVDKSRGADLLSTGTDKYKSGVNERALVALSRPVWTQREGKIWSIYTYTHLGEPTPDVYWPLPASVRAAGHLQPLVLDCQWCHLPAAHHPIPQGLQERSKPLLMWEEPKMLLPKRITEICITSRRVTMTTDQNQ